MEAQSLGFAHFLAQADGVGKAVLAILVAMSVITWYLIVARGIALFALRRNARAFLARFESAASLAEIEAHVARGPARDPYSRLARDAFRAVRQHRDGGGVRLVESGSADEFLARAMRRSLDGAAAGAESGLTVLASIGAAAPFVGLFGTVWGIYHALLAIGMSGQGTLDKVAGPVGEALIMTAVGLAVAIPAVLAYNAFVRWNRVLLERLEAFAHELFGFMATGRRAETGAAVAALDGAAAVVPARTQRAG